LQKPKRPKVPSRLPSFKVAKVDDDYFHRNRAEEANRRTLNGVSTTIESKRGGSIESDNEGEGSWPRPIITGPYESEGDLVREGGQRTAFSAEPPELG